MKVGRLRNSGVPIRRRILQIYTAKAYNTCIVPQAIYRHCSHAVHVTDKAGIQPIGHRRSLRTQTDLWPTSHTQHRSAISTPGIHVLLLIYRPRRDGRLSWQSERMKTEHFFCGKKNTVNNQSKKQCITNSKLSTKVSNVVSFQQMLAKCKHTYRQHKSPILRPLTCSSFSIFCYY